MKHAQLKFNCDQPWESFDKTPDGGFCQSCNKVVVDYTQMSINEVKEAIKKRPEGCGRFSAIHTDPAFITEIRIPKFKLAWAAGVSILLGSVPLNSFSQVKPNVVQVESDGVSTQIPKNHQNPKQICPIESQPLTTESRKVKHYKPRRVLYVNYRFPFVHYRRPRMGKFKPMGCPKF